MNIQLALSDHLKKFPSLPFLFVGSGLSRRYLSLETWESLLRRFSKLTTKDYEYFSSKANGNLPRVATMLAMEFHEKWWKLAKYKSARDKWRATATKSDSPIKIEISTYIRGKRTDPDDAEMVSEIEAFQKANIDGIITTNWDLLLETIFPGFEVFKGQEELLFANPQSIAEIYKIHGCCTSPNSLVLTEQDYADFNERNPYLASKLLNVFIEHPVIFLGYSLSDENIIRILNSITSCLGAENLERLRDRLVFVQRAGGQSETFQSTVMPIGGKVLPVTVVKTDDFHAVFSALRHNKRKFPARVLRRLKSHIHELVKTNDPSGQLFVADLDEESDGSKIEIVYGVGIAARLGRMGYQPISREQLMRAVVFETPEMDAEQLLRYTLPDVLKHSKNTPVFKYLRAAGYLNANEMRLDGLAPNLQKAASAVATTFISHGYLHKTTTVRGHKCGVAGLADHYDVKHRLLFIPLLEPKAIAVSELKDFLTANFDEMFVDQGQRSQLAKLVCFYDYLAFGPSCSEALSAMPNTRNADIKPKQMLKV
jgi:hypothetical protein